MSAEAIRQEMDRAWKAEQIDSPTIEDVALAQAIRGLLRATFERGYLAGRKVNNGVGGGAK